MADQSRPSTSFRARLVAVVAGLVVLAAGAWWIARAGASSADPADFYPDLVSEPPGAGALAIREWPEGSGDLRLLLRFDGVVGNRGTGALHIEGDPQVSALVGSSLAQVILDAEGEEIERRPLSVGGDDGVVRFEDSDGHGHWHLMEVVAYSLWDSGRTAEVLPAAKIGFCLADVQPLGSLEDLDGPLPPGVYDASNECEPDDPATTHLKMGISPGWSDVYSFTLALQWVDVTEVPPGLYWLAGMADPDDVLVESDEYNPLVFGTSPVVVPGYQATPSSIDVRGVTAFRLTHETFEAAVDETPDNAGDTHNDVGYPLGDVRYMVVEAPAHGTLDVSVGEEFGDPDVTYRPDDGYEGPDRFTFVAFDPVSAYPHTPAPAEIVVRVGG